MHIWNILAGLVKLKALDIIFIPQWDENSIIEPISLPKAMILWNYY